MRSGCSTGTYHLTTSVCVRECLRGEGDALGVSEQCALHLHSSTTLRFSLQHRFARVCRGLHYSSHHGSLFNQGNCREWHAELLHIKRSGQVHFRRAVAADGGIESPHPCWSNNCTRHIWALGLPQQHAECFDELEMLPTPKICRLIYQMKAKNVSNIKNMLAKNVSNICTARDFFRKSSRACFELCEVIFLILQSSRGSNGVPQAIQEKAVSDISRMSRPQLLEQSVPAVAPGRLLQKDPNIH